MAKIPVELQQAFKLFLQELQQHVAFLRGSTAEIACKLANGEDQLSATSEHAAGLEHRFHLIRGSAGFLQMTEVAAAATTGEKLFKGAKLNYDSSQPLVEHLEELIEIISSASEKADS